MNRVLCSCVLGWWLFSVAHAGDLNPPPGPVAPTMKTLVEVEPRTALSQENTPGDATARFIVTQPGSYYLTESVTTSFNESCVRVLVGSVTIDLNGFVIEWDGDGDGALVAGIDATGRSNVTVRNGTIGGMMEGVIAGDRAVVEGLTVSSSDNAGITVGEGSHVRSCLVTGCGARGIHVGGSSVVSSCRSIGNVFAGITTGEGCVVRECVADASVLSAGMFIGNDSRVIDSTASGNGLSGIDGNNATAVSGCVARDNGRDGINLNAQCVVTGCTASDNFFDGIAIGNGSSVTGCASTGNGSDGYSLVLGCVATGCAAASNTEHGFHAVGSVAFVDCAARSNTMNGFEADDGSSLRGCLADSNGGSGITTGAGALVESCTATGNAFSGISIGDNSTARACHADANQAGGIACRDRCRVVGNTVIGLLGSGGNETGISVIGDQSTIDGNVVSEFFRGYRTLANFNVFTRNVSRDNTFAYDVSGVGNQVGTVRVSPIGAGAWDNFEY